MIGVAVVNTTVVIAVVVKVIVANTADPDHPTAGKWDGDDL